MRVAMLVGTLMFSLVSGFYDLGVLDPASAVDNGAVQSFEDTYPPPPSWP